MGKYNEELVNAGIMLSGEGIKPSSQGKRVAFDGDDRTVTDGAFPATGELVAGFWMWEVKDMDEAVKWIKRSPNPMPGPSQIEIRPVFERGTEMPTRMDCASQVLQGLRSSVIF